MNRGISRTGVSVLSLCLGGVAAAQNVEEVIVTGFRESLEVALEAKRDSVNFTDSISAEDVGKLPDNNLAEALQRVPGVQISRTNGEGQQISIRGLGPSFARVLFDGMPISAASEGSVDQQARNREFDFDLLPSEIFSTLQVSKTPRASLVEGGLSGTIDLRTPRPFDYNDFQASYQLQAAYQSTSEEVDPRGSFLISKNWNDRFGALLSVSTSQRTFRTDGWSSQGWTSGRVPGNEIGRPYDAGFTWNLPSVFASPANQAPDFINESGLTNAQLSRTQVPRLGRPEVQIGDRDRIGGTLALQWAPTDALQFNLDVIYAKLESDFDRYANNLLVRNTTSNTDNETGFGYITPSNFSVDGNNTLTSGSLLNAKFWSENRLFQQESDFKHVGLGGSWQIADQVHLSAKASKAESDFRWRMTTYLFLSEPGQVDLQVRDGIPVITPHLDLANSSNWRFNTVRVQPRTREEENENLALDLTLGDDERNIRIGALANKYFRERLTYSSSVGFDQGTALTPFGYTGGAALRDFDITDFSEVVPVNYGEHFDDPAGYNRWIVSDLRAFSRMMDPGVLDANANLDFQNSGSFEEDNLSAYIEANAAFQVWDRTLRVNAGLRYVKTEHEMQGFIRLATTPAPATNLFGIRKDDYGRNTIDGEYSEFLPSLNLAYEVSDTVLARFSISQTMTRPNPNDLQPFTGISTAGVVSQGNQNLQPYLADQLDGGVEWYFSEGAVLGGNVFYKEITGFVERVIAPQPFRNAGIPLDTITDPTILALLPNGLDTILLFNTPVNVDDVTYLKGAELLYQQRLDNLLNGLGVTLNYTRLDSGSQVIVGLAKTNYNAVVYYEQDRFATRLSYNYRDDYVECEENCGSTSPEAGFRYQGGYLDLNSSVNFSALGQDLTLSLEVLNLLDEEEYSFYGYRNRANTLNRPGRQYILGIRGQF
ncbi:TonB-dependent receptor [Steroidobacter sp. S1-65]|uniref:TonB-dependent receptor n=1 Tax=Steroidobacter gossypii TaxID=2805490 RepID=A0ABS1X162_9GAMM|nr:TonB-dependent receptor [Steroidobacter gossypii]MBM0106965.1 TonB-dependent receptor [Steroidobacter gossypii]